MAESQMETRPPERIRAHYEIERELADQLRTASAEERLALYSQVYDALFERVPDHPQLTNAVDAAGRSDEVAGQLRALRRFLRPGAHFLEIGAGDCALSLAVARTGIAGTVIALDVSESIMAAARDDQVVQLVLSDGVSVDVPPGTIDLAYSNQVMEHLHPEDALAQLRNIRRALAPRGLYVCVTPNRLNGPHDVSMYFDWVATGFHLKEYTVTELSRMMHAAGFSRVSAYAYFKGRTIRVPIPSIVAVEATLERLPDRLGRRLASSRPLRVVLGICLAGRKE